MAMALQLLIVDDEPLARLRLRTLVQELQDAALAASQPITWQVAGEAAHAEQALALMRQHAVHALLLDIHMPGQGGLELAQALRAMPEPPAVVFVTAHAEHALRAFELDAVDYLTKPVRRERLAQALQRLADRVQRQAVAEATDAALVVSERGRMLRLPLADVLYCRAEQKLVLVRTAQGSYLIDDSLAELEDRLARLGGRFIRVHRNALVALSALRELELRQTVGDEAADSSEGWAVRVAPLDEWLAVSRRQVSAVKATLSGGAG
jgi:two-component system, LytTR family, response regulator AlgR